MYLSFIIFLFHYIIYLGRTVLLFTLCYLLYLETKIIFIIKYLVKTFTYHFTFFHFISLFFLDFRNLKQKVFFLRSVYSSVVLWWRQIPTWHASSPFSPPAQKLEAGRMNIFSVTLLIFLTHSLSLTIGTRASLILRGIGPARNNDS